MRGALFLSTALASVSTQCNLYASTTAPFSNDHCRSFCEDGDLTSLDAYCVLVDVSMHGDVTDPKTGTCYNQWVYGYSDEGPVNLSSMDGIIHRQASAVQCQRFCQETAGCESFLFRAVAQPGVVPHLVGDCILKDAAIIHGAIDTELNDLTGPTFCNTQQYHQCEHGGFT
ncbi:MAG: hypothetical protein KVP17_005238, partial [Porospora cf. gigantea B]|uniref:uncharacterized protein n=1 Tax=Porospora cf. gigantea B TaxID=2853592 RepID=UPI003571FACF